MNTHASIGPPLNRVDGRLKVTGGAQYAGDYPIPRLAHAVLIPSTIARGRITEIDSRAAERLPGVLAIITYQNAPRLQPARQGPGRAPSGQSPGVELMLQDERVHYFGQHVAIAVAETLETAREAASLVRFRYAPEPAATELEGHLARAVAPRQPLAGRHPTDSRRGDPEAALARAAVKLDVTYTTPTENHNPMEPHATTAVWDGSRLTVYDSTQFVYGVRRSLAAALGLKPEDVRVICRFMGGGFGSKGNAWPHVALAAVAARHVGRPVKLALTRPQMFTSVGRRSETRQRLRLGAARDGRLQALTHDSISQTSTYDEFVEPAALATRMLYACPNVATSHRIVPLDTILPTYMRAPGEATGVFALECALDELAAALRLDPLELRLRNYADRDPEDGKPWSSKSLKECYQAAAERFGWKERQPEPRSMRDGRLRLGWGMASATYPTNRFPASARARMLRDGSVRIETASQDLGTGAYTVMTQLAAETLGMPVERVRCELGDTDFPEGGLSAGSATTASVGSAVYAAARSLRSQLLDLAIADRKSPLHGLAPAQVGLEAGRLVSLADSSRRESCEALLSRQRKKELEAVASSAAGEERQQYSMHAFGATFAEVSVDPDLGEVRVRRMVSAYAAGRILNAKTAHSQLMGGNVWGVSMALLEHTVTDPRTGMLPNSNLADYLIPVNADIPQIEVVLIPEEDPYVNPIGVKGVGEIGIIGAAAAVANAVYHATGKRVRELPITAEKLL